MPENHTVLHYGSHEDQLVDLWVSDPVAATVVLVHGGYWRSKWDRELMAPLAQYFMGAGYNCANVEYRRGQDAPWPAPRDDVRAAFRAVREAVPGSQLLGVGHSVGGQLVLLNADELDRVVALAPVTNVARTFTEGLGNGAAQEYFHVSPQEDPELYEEASAIRMGQFPQTPTLVVQGDADTAVPMTHSLDYVRVRMEQGPGVGAMFVRNLDHMECVNADNPVWEHISIWLDRHKAV